MASERHESAGRGGCCIAVTTVLGSFIGLVRYLVKHYLNEIKPNSGSSIKDQVNRLEARVDDHLIDTVRQITLNLWLRRRS
jgi:hypothetical protein